MINIQSIAKYIKFNVDLDGLSRSNQYSDEIYKEWKVIGDAAQYLVLIYGNYCDSSYKIDLDKFFDDNFYETGKALLKNYVKSKV